MSKSKSPRLRFGLFAFTLITLAILLIATALYNTHKLTEQANLNNKEMNESFKALSSDKESTSFKDQLQTILINQTTDQLSQYSKNIANTAASNNSMLILWASSITLLTIGFAFLGFIEFKSKMQNASSIMEDIEEQKLEINKNLTSAIDHREQIEYSFSKLEQDKLEISKSLEKVESSLIRMEQIGVQVQEGSVISDLNLEMQGILNKNSKFEEKIQNLENLLDKINVERRISNDQWQELAAKCNTYLANISEDNGNYKKAVEYYDEVIRLLPNSNAARCWRAQAYAKLEQYRNAIVDYSQIIQTTPNSIDAYYLRGDSYLKLNDLASAHNDFSIAIEYNPNYALAYNGRGLTYSLEDYDKAIADLDKASRLDSRLAEPSFNKGNIYLALEKHKEASVYFTQAIDIKVNYTDAYLKRALCYTEMKEYNKAINDYSVIIANDKKSPDVFYKRAKLYENLENYSDAITDYSEAIRLSPNMREAYIDRGMAYYIDNQLDLALLDLDKSLALQPENVVKEDVIKVIDEIRREMDDDDSEY